MARLELLVVVATVLAVILSAWIIKTGLWRRGRLAFFTVAVLAGLALLTRRVGWGELVVVLVVLGLPILLVLPRRPPTPGGRR